MMEGVFTRLQKDLEKMDARINEKLEKLGECLYNDLFVELKNALEHFNPKLG